MWGVSRVACINLTLLWNFMCVCDREKSENYKEVIGTHQMCINYLLGTLCYTQWYIVGT